MFVGNTHDRFMCQSCFVLVSVVFRYLFRSRQSGSVFVGFLDTRVPSANFVLGLPCVHLFDNTTVPAEGELVWFTAGG